MILCVVIAAMFFMAYVELGCHRQSTIRCSMCGARHDEKHHKDCPWGR